MQREVLDQFRAPTAAELQLQAEKQAPVAPAVEGIVGGGDFLCITNSLLLERKLFFTHTERMWEVRNYVFQDE